MANVATKNLTVKFIADTSHFSKGAGKANGLLGDMGKKADSAKSSVMAFVKALPLPAKIAVGAFTALAAGFPKMISAGREAEDALVKLEVLFKSGTKAAEMYQKSLDFSTKTPFDPKEIVQASVVAGQYGKDLFKKIDGTQVKAANLVADMASFSGQSMEQAATALYRGDLALLDKYGKQGRKAYKDALKSGKLGTDEFIDAFTKNMGNVKTWMGMAEKKSKTISGIWSTIKGNLNLIFTYFSGATEGKGITTLWTNLRDIMTEISDVIGNVVKFMKPLFTDIGEMIGNTFRVIFELFKTLWVVLKPVLMPVLILLYGVFKVALWIINTTLKIIVWVLQVIQKAFNWFYDFLDNLLGITRAIKAIVGYTKAFIINFKIMWTIITVYINSWIDKMKKWFTEGLPKAIKKGWESSKNYIQEMFGGGKAGAKKTAKRERFRESIISDKNVGMTPMEKMDLLQDVSRGVKTKAQAQKIISVTNHYYNRTGKNHANVTGIE